MFNPFTMAASAGRNLFGGLFDGQPGAFSHLQGGAPDLFRYGMFQSPQAGQVPSIPQAGQVPARGKVSVGRTVADVLFNGENPYASIDRQRQAPMQAEATRRYGELISRLNLTDEEKLALIQNPKALGEAFASGSTAYTLGRNDEHYDRTGVVRNTSRPDPLKPEWKEITLPDGSTEYRDLNAGYNAQLGLDGAAPVQGVPRVNVPQPPQGATSPTGSGSRGYRNNNWLNIRDTADTWQGETGSDGSFVQFDTPENGLRAADRVLQTYGAKYGIDTLAGVIGRWAPSSENNTSAYVQTVAQDLGLDPNAKLNLGDAGVRQALLRSMAKVENGFDPFAYREEQAGRPYQVASLGDAAPPQGPAPVPRAAAGAPAPAGSPSVVKGSAPRGAPPGWRAIGGGQYEDAAGRRAQYNSQGVFGDAPGLSDVQFGKAVEDVTGINETLALVDAYDKAVRQLKPSEFSMLGKYTGDPQRFAAAQAAATELMMKLKGPQGYGLGVLTGPDMDILESVVSDPGKFKTALTQGQILPRLKQVASGLGTRRRGVEAAFEALGGKTNALPKMFLPADTQTVNGKRVAKGVPRADASNVTKEQKVAFLKSRGY